MCRNLPPNGRAPRLIKAARRRGLTFAELMVASAVTAIIATSVAALAMSVQSGAEFHREAGIATQHARVVLDRVQRTMRSAYANERCPGIISISTTVGSYTYPDTVAVWTPSGGVPADTSTTGLPRYNELTVYTPSATDPTNLLEITRPNDVTVAPDPTNTASWATAMNTFRNSTDSTIKVLTNKLRTASAATNQTRACVRFEVLLRPTKAAVDTYRNLSAANRTYANWRTIEWPQDMYTRNSGTRQTWCRTELQIMPDPSWQTTDPSGTTAVPFFGSVSLYYEIAR